MPGEVSFEISNLETFSEKAKEITLDVSKLPPGECGKGIWDTDPLTVGALEYSVLVTPAELEKRLRTLFKEYKDEAKYGAIKTNVPVFLIGPPGVGKTEIITSLANEFNFKLHTYIASTMDPTQVIGLPYPKIPSKDIKQGTTIWLPDETFVTTGEEEISGKNHVYFFDELNLAPPATQAAFYRLILEGKIGNIDLSNSIRIGAGNRSQDFENVRNIGLPLATRFQIYLIRQDIEDWLNWAWNKKQEFKKTGLKGSGIDVNDFVLAYAYLVRNKMKSGGATTQDVEQLWFCVNPLQPSLARATPRSWIRLSTLLNLGLDSKEDIIGALGINPGLVFYEWYRKTVEKVYGKEGKPRKARIGSREEVF